MNKFISEISGKNVLVFGLGRQGGGSGDAKWLSSHGANVRISDRDLTLCPEGQTKEQIDWAEIIIKNPAVADNHELIVYAKSLGKPVLTSIALFVKYSPITTIGVTGTRGKSTTVALITSMLEKSSPSQVISGGNIAGTSCLSLFDELVGKKYAVLELSSFQLHNFHDLKVSPSISLITNLYPDHLNRYPSMIEYSLDKQAICRYQQSDEPCFYNESNQGAVQIASGAGGKQVGYSSSLVMDWDALLPGLHNRENIAAMWAIGSYLGIKESVARQVVKDFVGIPFRQEKIATCNGVTYINDTTATTPVAAIKALQAATVPTIWITGGDTKNLPFGELIAEVEKNENLKKIIILGSKNIPDYVKRLTQVADKKIIATVSSMSEAVSVASSVAQAGDSVLLSPGFTSFDLFQNEFDRGRQFTSAVKQICEK